MKSLGVTLSLVLLVGAFATVSADKCTYSDYRLPQHIRPRHYSLWLDINQERQTQAQQWGSVTIYLTVDPVRAPKMPGDIIVLHANESISVSNVRFTTKGSDDNLVANVCRDRDSELIVVSLSQSLAPSSRGILSMSFFARIPYYTLSDHLLGVYENFYKENGKLKSVVNTHFEPASARRAFPCFDEPSFKATFDISLTHDARLVALSNSAIKQTTNRGHGRTETQFKRTPRMSTYLVAYAVGEFDHLEHIIDSGRLRVRTYTVPGKVEQSRFALDTAVRAINLLEEYFDMPVTVEKIDLVALPSFRAAAMENWGLNFFIEKLNLHDPVNSTPYLRGCVVKLVVHELSHQWFGNLVTMDWWNDLWLNEGFATWAQNHFTNELYPEFKWDIDYIGQHLLVALEKDAKPDTHAIQVEDVGRNPDSLFDGITYRKGASVIRFIHDDYLGAETFREAIRKYVKKYAFGSTKAADLWNTLTESSGLPVNKLMKSWITQPGHPEIQADFVSGPGGKFLHLKQSRHFSGEPTEEQKRAAEKQKWMIPISLIVGDHQGNRDEIKSVLDDREMRYKLPDWFHPDSSNHWVKLNAGFKGFYRVRYSRDLLMRLEQPCRSKALDTVDRLNVIYDVFAGTIDKSLSNDDVANIFGWFDDDQEGAVIVSLYEAHKSVVQKLDFEALNKIKTSRSALYRRIYEQRGFHIDSDEWSITDAKGLSRVYTSLLEEKFEPLIKDAIREFDEHGNKGSVSMRPIVYQAVVEHDTDLGRVSQMQTFLEQTTHFEEMKRLSGALKKIDPNTLDPII